MAIDRAFFESTVKRYKRVRESGTLKAKLISRIGQKIPRIPIVSRLHEYILLSRLIHFVKVAEKKYEYCQVLNVYKRNTLAMQIKSLLRQSILPTKVIIYHNLSYLRSLWIPCRQDVVLYTHNPNWNAKYHGRFFNCLLVNLDYYVVWDDDINPGFLWNERTLELVREQGCIATANGRTLVPTRLDEIDFRYAQDIALPASYFDYEDHLGDGCSIDSNTIVDYGGHSWTFTRSTLIDMVSIEPPSLENSEDFHVSAAAYIRSGTKTIVLSQDPLFPSTYPDLSFNSLAADAHASHRISPASFLQERANIIQSWVVSHGFLPVAKRHV